MSTHPRIDVLMLARATEGLSRADAIELDELLAELADRDQDAPDIYEQAAAMICIAVHGRGEGLPQHLAEKLERDAREIVGVTE